MTLGDIAKNQAFNSKLFYHMRNLSRSKDVSFLFTQIGQENSVLIFGI